MLALLTSPSPGMALFLQRPELVAINVAVRYRARQQNIKTYHMPSFYSLKTAHCLVGLDEPTLTLLLLHKPPKSQSFPTL